MSTRYIKKVFGSDDITEVDSENEKIDKTVVNNEKQKLFNVFDLLDNECDNENEESIEENDIEKEESENEKINEQKSSGKKKRKRHKKKQKNNQDVSKNLSDDEDEIEKTVREINKLLGEPQPSVSQQVNSADNQLQFSSKTKEQTLCIQHKHLNPYNELKRIFGSKTVQAEKNTLRNRARTGHIKKTWLVPLKDNMLPIAKSGISMVVDRSVDRKDVQYFMYEHSTSYRQIQQKFINAVESLIPENIINIVNEYPFHIDALLQAAELCKMSEELAMSASLIEKALFYLEYNFHPLFNMTTGKCRINYKKQQNRAFFITLFKHLILVGGRACYRTSLELCKLLLSLDPEGDPLAVILMIDFYAIRAKEYEWFCEFCNLWENSRNLSQLPNIAYSLALAYFHLGQEEKANECLQNALSMFPGVLMPLLDKCSVNIDSKVISHGFFTTKADTSTPPALEKLQSLYIARSFHLWKEMDVLQWLESQVNSLLQRVDMKDDYIKFCHVKRTKRYQGKLPRNILRHIILSDIKDVTVNVQEIQNEGTILSHDPLPPLDSINLYSNPVAVRRTNQSNSNLLSLFFSSFFVDIERDVALNELNQQNENRGQRDE